MTAHRRRDRFPLSVILMITMGVCAVYPALVADSIDVRRISFASALVLLALGMFMLGIQIWSWVRATDDKLRSTDRVLDQLHVRVDAVMALLRHSRTHREEAAGSPPDGGPPTRLTACRSRGWWGRVWHARPGAASAAAAGILIAAGAAGVAMLILVPDKQGQPAGGQAEPIQPPPSMGPPASTVPSPGEHSPVDVPDQPVVDRAPPTTITVTVTETAVEILAPTSPTRQAPASGAPMEATGPPTTTTTPPPVGPADKDGRPCPAPLPVPPPNGCIVTPQIGP